MSCAQTVHLCVHCTITALLTPHCRLFSSRLLSPRLFMLPVPGMAFELHPIDIVSKQSFAEESALDVYSLKAGFCAYNCRQNFWHLPLPVAFTTKRNWFQFCFIVFPVLLSKLGSVTWCLSVKPLLRYGDFTVFFQNGKIPSSWIFKFKILAVDRVNRVRLHAKFPGDRSNHL